jgi:hypothetical protein
LAKPDTKPYRKALIRRESASQKMGVDEHTIDKSTSVAVILLPVIKSSFVAKGPSWGVM